MHPDGCKPVLSGGTLYINGEKFGEFSEANCTYEPDELGLAADQVKVLSAASSEFSCTVKMASDEFVRFAHVILGIDQMLKDACPNKRVVHLACHAKKHRIWKKNYRRMIKICERGINHEN